MPSLNKIEIIGHVGSESELRFTPSGKPVTSFNVAVNRYYQSDGERKEETEWFTVVSWNKLAETCNQYVFKGQLIYCSGRVSLHRWKGQEGEERSRLELTAYSVLFLTKNSTKTPDSEFEESEELPF